MNITTALPAGLIALTLLATPGGDELTFAPTEGSSVTRTFREVTSLELTSAVQVMDGEENSEDELDVEIKSEREFVFVDEYVTVGEERAEKIARTYQSISSRTWVASTEASGSNEGDVEGTSELEGATVVFTWDEDDEEFTAAYSEASAEGYDADLLDGLTAVADLALLLPDESPSEGDSWSVDPAAFGALLGFGGDLSLIPGIEEDNDDEAPVLMCFFLSLAEGGAGLEGKVEMTYAGMVETDDGEFASISIAVDISSARDGSEAMRGLTEALGMDADRFEGMGEGEFRYAFEGEGTLLWDVENHRAHHLALEGNLETVIVMSMEMGGMEMSMEMTFAGPTELTVGVE